MTRWGLPSLPSIIWSGLPNPAVRDRASHGYYSIKSPRPYYDSTTPASYRLHSRVSVRDKTRPSYTSSTYFRPSYTTYQTSSGKYDGGCGTYDSYGASFYRSSRSPKPDTYYRSTPTTKPSTFYYTPVQDACDGYCRHSHHRSSTGHNYFSDKYNSKHTTKSSSAQNPHTTKRVHWDESTFRGHRGTTDHDGERLRRHRRRSDSDHEYAYDRHGRFSSSSNAYYYAEGLSNRSRDYYDDEMYRRQRKSHNYRATYGYESMY
ncbi:hypothetical protein SBRCBS47491_008457 [Sporothrix bragantina]|uniref:Uncharacterized protein n=1 Tax=Sporothrix bragantina TaxID=671064 RepID=A0ABP0CLL3_9PEZI